MNSSNRFARRLIFSTWSASASAGETAGAAGWGGGGRLGGGRVLLAVHGVQQLFGGLDRGVAREGGVHHLLRLGLLVLELDEDGDRLLLERRIRRRPRARRRRPPPA